MTSTHDHEPAGDPGPGTSTDPGPRLDRQALHDVDRLRRSRSDRYLAGVAGGLGRHFGIDPTVVRVLLVVMTFFGGAGVILYGACWLLVPEDDSERAMVETSADIRRLALGVVAVLAVLAVFGAGWGGLGWGGFGWDGAWPLIAVLVVVGVVLANRGSRSSSTASRTPTPPPPGAPVGPYAAPGAQPYAAYQTAQAAQTASAPAASTQAASTQAASTQAPSAQAASPTTSPTDRHTGVFDSAYSGPAYSGPTPPAAPTATWTPPPRRRRTGVVLFWPTLALIAVALGVLGIYDIDHQVADGAWLALPLAITGLMLVIGAFVGRPGGLIPLGVLLVPVLAITSAVGSVSWDEQPLRYTPTTSSQVLGEYQTDNGRIVLDLSRISDPAALDGRTLTVHLNAGEVRVILPATVTTDVDAQIRYAGDITVDGRRRGGLGPELRTVVAVADPVATVRLDADVRVGQITVERR